MLWRIQSKGTIYRTMGRVVPLILFWAGLSMVLAQLPTATVLGVLKDATGAVVPGAALTARNTDTGQTRNTISAEDGSYRFPALPVGRYEIRAEHPGFRSEVRGGLTLSVSQEAVVNFTLEVGAIEQTIAVTAEAPLVNTTSGSLGGLVDEQRIADLPLNGRNYTDLALLQPGVTQHRNYNTSSTGLSGTLYSSNGAPIRSNNYLLDGANLTNLYGATAASITNSALGVEGIREYRVVTNSFSAEYGMTMGSQMMIVSKNGTNNVHGSLFEYLRNSALDARNFFDYQTPTNPRRLPAFTRNNFGGSLGGPLQQDKTFFYGVYEGTRERLGRTTVTNVIPSSAKVDGGAGGVPQIAPVIQPLLALFPDPNLPNNRYTFPFRQPTAENYGQMRVDQTFSTEDTLFGRYTVQDSQQTTPLEYPQFKTLTGSRGQFSTLSENHIFSPTLLNTFRFSYSRTRIRQLSPSGISGPQFSFVPGEELGQITIGGVSSIGANNRAPTEFKQNIFTWSDDLFYTRGRHSLKFGALFNRFQQFMFASLNNRGSASFANIASFLQAQPSTYTAVTPGSILDRTYHYTTLGFYVQDDLRLRSNFTFNLGLRYEFHTQLQEVRGHGAALRDIQHDANTTLGPPFENPSLKNLSPRFGFAWDMKGDGKTAVRGGFGLLYDVGVYGSSLVIGVTATPPFSTQSTVQNPPTFSLPLVFPASAAGKTVRGPDYFMQQPHILQYNLTVERQMPFAMALTLSYGGSRGINILQFKEGNPTVPQILSDGRQFWPVNPPRTNPNWTSIAYITGAGNSWYNSLQVGLTKRLNKGLQFQSSYTWSKNLDETQGQVASDNAASSTYGADPTHRHVDKGLASFDTNHNWRFNAIYRLPEPSSSGGLAAKLLQGWWVSGILSLQGGYPFTPVLGSNRSRSGVNGGAASIDRPDLAPGRGNDNIVSGATAGCRGVAQGEPLGTPNLYYDPCAFTIQPAGFLGNLGRNTLRGPGFANLDFSLAKNTALRFLGESGKLEFRAEVFNLTNRAHFGEPNTTVFAARADAEPVLSSAGTITGTVQSSRQIQFALKILF